MKREGRVGVGVGDPRKLTSRGEFWERQKHELR